MIVAHFRDCICTEHEPLLQNSKGFFLPNQIILLSSDAIRRAITRMAHEIVERNQGTNRLLLAGIQTRGVTIAYRIAEDIAKFEGSHLPVGALDINLYRDDLTSHSQPIVRPSSMPCAVENMRVVLVDDVLFTGRTIRSALNALIDLGRPEVVQLAVLIDRGHRELPIRPDYVGKNTPTALNQEVKVQLNEIDKRDEVILLNHEGILST